MKRVMLVLVGVAAAGFLSVGLVRAADDAPELGESVVVSPNSGVSIGGGRTFTAPSAEAEPVKQAVPAKKAEPVKPPAPKPGGRDDDDDGTDRRWRGGDDDGDDGGDDGGGGDDDD